MTRFLLAALLIYFAYRYFSRIRNLKRRATENRGHTVGGEMVSCSKCGTFVVAAEAISRDGMIFCSEECKNK